MNRKKFPELWLFFHGYFNQDFFTEFEYPEEAVEKFLHEASQDQVEKVIKELEELLSLELRATDWQHLLYRELGCSISLVENNEELTEWMYNLYSTLSEHINI